MEEKHKMHVNYSPFYKAAGFYMLRAPVLSAQTFMRITAGADERASTDLDTWLDDMCQQSYAALNELLAEPVVERALLVASADIFEGIARIQNGKATHRQAERVYAKLFRYLIRMSTRPTPFGLFSGVSIGTLGAHTTAQMGTPSVAQIRTRPDMGWLLSIIQKIEEDTTLLPQLHVTTNRAAYTTGARVVIPYADVYGKGDARSIALRATPVVTYVLEQAREPVLYNDLRKRVLEAFPFATDKQVDGLLRQLWEHHFLISDLRPPLTRPNPEQYLLEHLRRVPQAQAITTVLEQIVQCAAEIDRMGIDGSVQLLRDLSAQQKLLVTDEKLQSQPYQVDTALKLDMLLLNNEIGEAVADTTDTLLRLARSLYGLPHLREYALAFTERYGTEAEVPLLDLLSPEFGLDAPPTYTEPPRSYPLHALTLPTTRTKDRVICTLLTQAAYEHAMEIELTDTILEELIAETAKLEYSPPTAIEMYLQLHATSREAIDQGEWRGVITPAYLAEGGKTFCRFFDIIGEEGLNMLSEYTKQQETLYPDLLFAELSYLPTFGRGANVTIRPMLHPYEIVVNTTPSVPADRVISLEDLVVGVKGERFYLRSLSHGKQVIVTQSHMLNIVKAPNICRFLLEVSQNRNNAIAPFTWGSIVESAPFLPRVVRKKIVLSPAQWNLCMSMIRLTENGSRESHFFRGLQQWREKWRVPRYVYLAQFDNRLLLDLDHPLAVAELHDMLEKAGEHGLLRLQEMLPDFEHLWLKDRDNRPYVAELVVPVILHTEAMREINATMSGKFPKQYPLRPIPDLERRQLPGQDWTFLKLYAPFKQHDEIITRGLPTIVHKMNQQQLIDRWFFMRYADPEPHLRIRFHAANEQVRDRVLIEALTWSQALVQQRLIGKVVVDTYDREIERYGGPQAIDALERVFAVNSASAREIVAIRYTKEIALDPLAVAVFTLDQFFEMWGLDLSTRLKYLQERTEKYGFSDAFHAQRRLFCELLMPWNSNDDLTIKAQREKLWHICQLQRPTLEDVSSHVRMLAEHGELWEPEEAILSSLAHMHINRLLGINKEQEAMIYSFWRHTLESLQRRKTREMAEPI